MSRKIMISAVLAIFCKQLFACGENVVLPFLLFSVKLLCFMNMLCFFLNIHGLLQKKENRNSDIILALFGPLP